MTDASFYFEGDGTGPWVLVTDQGRRRLDTGVPSYCAMPTYTKHVIVRALDCVTFINGEARWYQPHSGAPHVPFLGPHVSDWLDWREANGERLRFG